MSVTQLVSQPMLIEQIRKLGGLIFSSIDKSAKSGGYVMDSQLRHLLDLLNQFSWRHETLEERVDQMVTVGTVLCLLMSLMVMGLIAFIARNCVNKSGKQKDGSVSTTFGSTMRQNVLVAESRNEMPNIGFSGETNKQKFPENIKYEA